VLGFLLIFTDSASVAGTGQEDVSAEKPPDRVTELSRNSGQGNPAKDLKGTTEPTSNAPEDLSERVIALAAKNRSKEATQQYEALPADYEKSIKLLKVVAECYCRDGLPRKAKSIYDTILERTPDDDEAVRGLVMTLFDMGEYDRALEALHLSSPQGCRMRAMELALNGSYEKALRLLEKALRLTDNSPDILSDYVIVLYSAKKFEEAIKRYEAMPPEPEKSHELLGVVTKCHLELKQFDKAEAVYRRILENNPRDKLAARSLVSLLMDLGQYDKALAEAEKGLRHHPKDLNLLRSKGAAATEKKDYRAAVLAYDRIVKLEPRNSEAAKTLTDLLLKFARSSKPAEALKALKRAVRMAHGSPEIHLEYVIMLAKCGRCSQAIRQYEMMPPEYERPVSLLRSVAECYYKKKQFGEACGLYRSVLKKQPADPAAAHFMVQILIQRGKLDQAAEQVGKSLLHHPKDVSLLSAKGLIHREKKEAEAAVRTYETILKIDPRNEEAAKIQSGLLFNLSRTSKPPAALGLLEKALRLRPGAPEILTEYIVLLANNARCKEAVEQYETIPAEREMRSDALLAVAECYRKEEKSGKAARIYRSVLREKPDDYEAGYGLASVLMKNGKHDEALEQTESTLSYHPDDLDLMFAKGAIQRKIRQHEAAVRTYDRILEISPEDPKARGFQALLLVQLARECESEKSLGMLEKALLLTDSSPSILTDYVRALVKAGNCREAIKQYERIAADYETPLDLIREIAQCCRQEKQSEKAGMLYRAILGKKPEDLAATHALVGTLTDSGELDQALEEIDKGLSLNPGDLELLFAKGTIQRGRKALGAAVETYDEILSLDPANQECVDIQTSLLLKLARKSEPEAAFALLEKALDLTDNSPEVRAKYVVALAKEARCEDAIRQYEALPSEYEKPFRLRRLAAACYRKEAESERAAARPLPASPPATEPSTPVPEPATASVEMKSDGREPGPVSALIETPEATHEGRTRSLYIDLDLIHDPSPKQTQTNLKLCVARVLAIKPTRVYLRAFSSAAYRGYAKSVYFRNSVLPMKSDLLPRAAEQFQTNGLVVYASMPTLGLVLPDEMKERRLLVMSSTAGKIHPSLSWCRRLTPFSEEVREIVVNLYENLATNVHCDGILFEDDAYLTDLEDFGPEAVAKCKSVLGLKTFDPDNLTPDKKSAWYKLKTQQLNTFIDGLMQTVRQYWPQAEFARKLYAPVLHYPSSEKWLAQNYEDALGMYDQVVVMAYPEAEDVSLAGPWLKGLLMKASEYEVGLAKTVFMLQSYDERGSRWISGRRLRRHVRQLVDRGARHVAYSHDDYRFDRPRLKYMCEVMTAPALKKQKTPKLEPDKGDAPQDLPRQSGPEAP